MTPFCTLQLDPELLPEGPVGLSSPWKGEAGYLYQPSWFSAFELEEGLAGMTRRVGRGRGAAASASDHQDQLLVGTGLLHLPSACPSLIFASIPVPPPSSSCRIKQPALKLQGNKDTICKPCHMAQLASVCGSDGHTYSSVVRSPSPRVGGVGVYLKPQGAEERLSWGLLWGPQG